MGTPVVEPNWVPIVRSGSRVLIVGASGGIGRSVVKMLLESPEVVLGLHSTTDGVSKGYNRIGQLTFPLVGNLESENDCIGLVEDFSECAGGIDALIVLCGGVTKSCHWRDLTEKEWQNDINLNLNIPFFLSRRAMAKMGGSRSASIVLTGTESALHGGSPTSFPYGVAKRGIECLVQGLAREGASKGITVNGVRLGFIASGFHERWLGKSIKALLERSAMIPMKRAGTPQEAAALIIYLLSDWARFITGQMLAITGGDWL